MEMINLIYHIVYIMRQIVCVICSLIAIASQEGSEILNDNNYINT